MPQTHPPTNPFSDIEKSIDLAISISNPRQLSDCLFTVTSKGMIYYWYQIEDDIILCTEIKLRNMAYAISLTGKRIKNKGEPPYASDLYIDILNDMPKSFGLTSDFHLSNEGYAIWQQLYRRGNNIFVAMYDYKNSKEIYEKIKSLDDMDNYYGDDAKYSNYRFTLIK